MLQIPHKFTGHRKGIQIISRAMFKHYFDLEDNLNRGKRNKISIIHPIKNLCLDMLDQSFISVLEIGKQNRLKLTDKEKQDLDEDFKLLARSKNVAPNLFKEIIMRGADLDLQDSYGKTAYDLAKTDEIREMLKNAMLKQMSWPKKILYKLFIFS